MVITEDFVYIHLPKTGGTFVEQVLQRLFDNIGLWYLDTSKKVDRVKFGSRDQHESVREIPPAHRDKPVVFTMRNPYDWYISQYEFAWWKVEPGREFDDLAVRARYDSYPDLAFDEYVTAVNDWRLWPPGDRAEGAEIEKAGNIGLFTWMFIRFLALSPHSAFAAAREFGSTGLSVVLYPQINFLRTDRLNQDLHDWLVRVGFSPSDVSFILDADRIGRQGSVTSLAPGEQMPITTNQTKGTHAATRAWRDYFDSRLKAFVRQREHLLFELFPDFEQ